jgi:hypothetical protein
VFSYNMHAQQARRRTDMLSYHGDPAVKAAILGQLREHQAADEIVQGFYWENGKGCSVGCTVHGSDHALYESLFGIPRVLAYVEDVIFEGLPAVEAKNWPVRFMEAVPVGADLSRVGWKFLAWVLRDLPALSVTRPDVRASVEQVTAIMDRLAAGEAVPENEIAVVRRAAWAAEASAQAASAEAAWAVASAEAAAAEAASEAASAVSEAAEAVSWAAEASEASEAAAWAASVAAWAAASAVSWAVARAAGVAEAAAEAGAVRENAYWRQADKLLALVAEAGADPGRGL